MFNHFQPSFSVFSCPLAPHSHQWNPHMLSLTWGFVRCEGHGDFHWNRRCRESQGTMIYGMSSKWAQMVVNIGKTCYYEKMCPVAMSVSTSIEHVKCAKCVLVKASPCPGWIPKSVPYKKPTLQFSDLTRRSYCKHLQNLDWCGMPHCLEVLTVSIFNSQETNAYKTMEQEVNVLRVECSEDEMIMLYG